MQHRKAFALIELPVVLIVLFLAGLLVAFVFSLFSGSAPWYAWLICGLILPVGASLLAVTGAFLDGVDRPARQTRKQDGETDDSAV